MLAISSTLQSALEADALHFAWLVAFPNIYDGTTGSTGIFFTDAEKDIQYGGNAYASKGDILSLPGIVRERGIKLQGYSFTLAGASQQNAVRFEAENMTGQICEVFLVLLDASGTVIGPEAINMYRGTVQTWRERENGARSTVEVSLTSPWSKPNLTAGRITSNTNQQDRFPGDDFFKFAHRERKNIGWGGEN